LEGAQAAISGMDSTERNGFSVKPIQDYTVNLHVIKNRYKHDLDIRQTMWN